MTDHTLDTIGKKLKGGERRDAVHFAVAPVSVNGFMRAGERVKFAPGSTDTVMAWDYDDEPPVGIIDPFLDDYVANGERCWLFLFPSTITGLRHEWTHPAFPDQQSVSVAPQPEESSREYSERWLREFAERYRGDYDEMIAGVAAGGGAFFGDDLEYGDFRPDSEFWRHVSVVTGKTFTDTHIENTAFRCAC
jgi:hypothetical protein